MGKRVKDEEFDFSDITDEEFDFSDIEDEEFDFKDIEEDKPNYWEVVQGVAKAASPIGRAVYDFGRTVYSGLVDTVPQTVAQANEVRKSSMYSETLKDYIKNNKSVEFQKYVRGRESKFQGVGGFFESFEGGVDEFVDKYGKEFLEAQGLGEKIEQFEGNLPEVTKRRQDLETYVQLQKSEAGDKLRGVVQDFRDIGSVSDFTSYIGGMAGQAAYQIPLSVASRGTSSFVMEAATVYDKQLDNLAQEYGISREEVIERNLDDPAAGQTYAILAAGLDAASAGNVIGAFRRQGGTLLKKFITQQVEGVTEATQGVLEDLGAGGKLAENLTSEGIATRANEYFGGVIGGSFNFFGKSNEKKLIDKAINETADTGDANLNAKIDADATLSPQEEDLLKTRQAEKNLEEIKAQEEKLVQEKQKLEEQKQKLDESETENKEGKREEIQNRLNEINSEIGTLSTENEGNLKSEENTATNVANNAENLKSAQFEAENNQRVRELEEQIRNIQPDQDITDLVKQLNEARQQRDNARIAFEESKKKKPRPEKTIRLTASEAIKAQFEAVTRGMKRGVKLGVDETNKLIDKVRGTLKEHNLSDKQRDAILTKVRNTDVTAFGTSKRSVNALNQFIDNVVRDADYADKITEAKSLNKKMRKLAKNKKNLQPYRTLAKLFSSINPEDAFINQHLKHAGKIVAALSNPSTGKYSSTEISEIEEYAVNLKRQIEEGQQEESATEEKVDKSGEKLKELQVIANGSLERLKSKDLSDFDESERSVIESIKKIDIGRLTPDQLTTVIRVTDNIVDNNSLVEAPRVDALAYAQDALTKIKNLMSGKKKFGVGWYGKPMYNNSRVFDAIALDGDIGYKLKMLLGSQDLFAAGSRVEKYMINKTKELAKLVNSVNGGFWSFNHKNNILQINNRVRMTAYALLVRRPVGAGNEHIPQIKANIEQTISVYEEAGEKEKVAAWKEAYERVKNIETVEDALAQFKSTDPRLYKVWKFISDTFKNDVNESLRETTENVHNTSYIEEENYTTSRIKQVINRKGRMENFVEGVESVMSTKQAGKIKARQSKTSLAATRKMSEGQAYSDDFIGDQLRALRDSKYDIEASALKMKLGATLYSKEFEDAVGYENAELIRNQTEKGDMLQREMGGVPDDEFIKILSGISQYAKNIGAAKALGSVIGQAIKQIPPVVIKAFNTHLVSGSLDLYARSLKLKITPNIEKLLDNSQIGTAGFTLGGIERGSPVSFNLAPSATSKFIRGVEKFHQITDTTVRKSLGTITWADAAAKRRIGLSFYLKKLRDLGVKEVDLEEEYKLQGDPKRKEAVAYMEHLLSTTQTPSNPGELAPISRNTGNKAVNIIKNVILPFSRYTLEAKARLVIDVRKVWYNPTKENFADLVGDLEEIAIFSAIQLYVMNTYKDWIKEAWEHLLGLEPPEKDEEYLEREERQRVASAMGQGLITMSPIAIGTFGEVSHTFLINRFAKAVYEAKHNEDLSYRKWKRETGGFLYEDDIDWGLLTLGFEPTLEGANQVINLVDLQGDGEIVMEDAYENVKILEPSQNLERLMWGKTFIEALSTVGINEADWFNQFRKIYKEQLREELKEADREED